MPPPRNQTAEALSYWVLGVEFALRLARARTKTKLNIREDVEQAALTGLWAAALVYDPTLCPQFTMYAWNHVRGEIRDELRNQSVWGRSAERSKLRACQKGIEVSSPTVQPLEDYQAVSPPDNDWLEDREYVAHLLLWLSSDKLRTVARRRWLEGLTCVTIAHQMALQPQTVRLMCSQAFKEMKCIVDRELRG